MLFVVWGLSTKYLSALRYNMMMCICYYTIYEVSVPVSAIQEVYKYDFVVLAVQQQCIKIHFRSTRSTVCIFLDDLWRNHLIFLLFTFAAGQSSDSPDRIQN